MRKMGTTTPQQYGEIALEFTISIIPKLINKEAFAHNHSWGLIGGAPTAKSSSPGITIP